MNNIPDDACGEHPSNYKEDYRAMFATLTDELRNVLTDEDSRLSHGARRAVLYVKEMLATFPVDFVFDSGEVKADPSAEPVPLPDTVYAALSDQAKRRTSRENVVDVLHALIAAELRAAPVAAQQEHCAGPNCKALDDDTGPPHSPECRAKFSAQASCKHDHAFIAEASDHKEAEFQCVKCGEVHVAQAPQQADAAVAAIQFALQADDGLAWLGCWNEGDFDACRNEWPETPEECFIGADPLHPGTKAALAAQAPAAAGDALTDLVHSMFRSGNGIPVERITISRAQYDAAMQRTTAREGE